MLFIVLFEPQEYYCDRDDDCGDGSDEPLYCNKRCRSNEMACNNGKCVLAALKCNGMDNCGDNSDEADCSEYRTVGSCDCDFAGSVVG